MSITIRFVGGPTDGRTLEIPDVAPPWRYRVATPPPLTEYLANPVELTPKQMQIPVAEYEPLHENGWPSRADDGAYLYRHRPAPVTPEDRRAMEEKRRAAQAAEAQRAAERDEAWREIRKERPDFPEDRRDLF